MGLPPSPFQRREGWQAILACCLFSPAGRSAERSEAMRGLSPQLRSSRLPLIRPFGPPSPRWGEEERRMALFARLEPAFAAVVPLVEKNDDPAGGGEAERQDEIEVDFRSGHGRNPPRTRLPAICRTMAAKSQITLPFASVQDIAKSDKGWPRMTTIGAIRPTAIQAVDARSSALARSLVRSFSTRFNGYSGS